MNIFKPLGSLPASLDLFGRSLPPSRGILDYGPRTLTTRRFIDTSFLTANRLTQEKWPQTFFEFKLENMMLSKFMGTGPENIIQINRDLSKGPGDKITFQLIPPLGGAGGYDDSTIESSEESMAPFNFPVSIHERSHGVRSAGIMSAKRTTFDVLRDGAFALARWAAEQLDNDLVYALSGIGNQNTYAGEGTSNIQTVNEKAPSSNRIVYGGQTASGTVTIETSDSAIGQAGATDYQNHYFGTKMISIMKRKAVLASPKFRPLNIGGKSYWVMFIHPLQAKALKEETSAVHAWAAIQAAANVRGINNPLFTKEGAGKDRVFDGAIGVWDDVILYEYERIQTRVDGEVFDSGDTIDSNIVDGTARVARALFCGAQAGVIAFGREWRRLTKNFDYGRKPGVATDTLYGVSKTQFNDPGANQSTNTAQEDFAVMCLDTSVKDD